ncbi:NAD(P)-binding domain-containing protein [Streptomyces sp. NBC_01310]|uniref:NAD(P)-binding domain-containing protein n=1 Tax=Streptomyces sp. NBC_01310 TaxID=2903820 RepID=UPI0035B5FD31
MQADIRTGRRVIAVRADGTGFTVELEDGGQLQTQAVVAASGSFGRPHRPDLPGLETFAGQVLHAADYRSPTPFAGQRVVVVGAGNSAVQIAAELALDSRTSLATRAPVKFARQHLLGKDLHFWLTRTGLDSAPLGRLLKTTPAPPVLDDGRYRAALTAGAPTAARCSPASPTTGARGPTAPRSGWTRRSSPPATAPTCPTSPNSTAPSTPPDTPTTAAAPPPPIRAWRSSGWSGSAVRPRTRCAGSAGMPPGRPAIWPHTWPSADPCPLGSMCVNIDVCRM